MYIQKVTIKNFRNIERENICFSPEVNILYGGNGQGKSSILESIYFLATARSFRTARSKWMIRQKLDGFFINAAIRKDEIDSEIKIYYSPNKKKISINNQVEDRLISLVGQINTVALTSDDIYLVKGDAGKRRKFLDIQSSLMSEAYFENLRKYSYVLKSRNKLLKDKNINYNDLEVWTNKLVDIGAWIISYRYKWVEKINVYAKESYGKIARYNGELMLKYNSIGKADIRENYRRKIKENFRRDVKYKTTHIGPHRDDVEIFLNGDKAKDFASEGQQRSIVLALKIGEYRLMREIKKENPIILIDDVLNELDEERKNAFFPFLKEGQQVIITTTQLKMQEHFPKAAVFNITNGKVS